jgi:uncharacterized membrane protein YqgA involved in biofilm formation
MGGTLLNMLTVAVGSTLGLLVGNRLPSRIQESIVTALGLITFFFGIQNAFQTGNPIITLLSVAIGVLIGEWLRIDLALEGFGGWLQKRFTNQNQDAADAHTSRQRFITGFVTASLVFCVGPLTFLGSLYDGMGLAEGFQMLAIKSTLDGFAALAFAASFGIGVAFSIVTIFVLQGGLSLVGYLAGAVMTEPMLNETTAVGGILLMGLALVLLDIKQPRVANFLPALLIAPLLVWLAGIIGINIYPTF